MQKLVSAKRVSICTGCMIIGLCILLLAIQSYDERQTVIPPLPERLQLSPQRLVLPETDAEKLSREVPDGSSNGNETTEQLTAKQPDVAILRGFGWQKLQGQASWRYYTHVELQLSGATVYAWHDGLVEQPSSHASQETNQQLAIRHGEYIDSYQGLASVQVQPGMNVKAGQPLGTAERLTDDRWHVELGLRYQGRWLDPASLLGVEP